VFCRISKMADETVGRAWPCDRTHSARTDQYSTLDFACLGRPHGSNVKVRMNVIATASFTLEPQVSAHAEEMFRVLSDPALYEYENEPPPSLEWLRARFTKLESRFSPEGQEQWLNWVIRLPTSELIGFVQATVRSKGGVAIAYVLSSAYWGRGLARQAVQVMISELVEHYGVRSLCAVLKQENLRSLRLLDRLGFSLASPAQHVKQQVEPGELLMLREIRAVDEKSAIAPSRGR
jgi:[ribosomal protein S5]-alanine N-acetyltransferase